MSDFLKDAFKFLGEPLNTSDLKARLTQLRDVIAGKQAQQIVKAGQLDSLNDKLADVDAKAQFLVDITTQSLDMFVPPQPEGMEAEYDRLNEKLYDPLATAQLYTAAGAITFLGLSVLVPATLKAVGFAARSTKITALAKSTKFATLGKMGSLASKATVALLLIDFALKLTNAKKINDYMRDKQQELMDLITEADQELARYDIAIKMREDFLKNMLEETGFETVGDYLVQLRLATADIAKHATIAEIARNMFRAGFPSDRVALLTEGLDAAVAARLEQRLNAEIMLMEGAAPEEIAEKLQMTRYQIDAVSKVLKVRGDAALGYDDAALSRKHNVVDAIADLQINLAETSLASIWPGIEAKADAGPLSLKAIIPADALVQLMTEIDARAALLAGGKASEAAETYGIDIARMQEIEEELPFVREQLRVGSENKQALAVKLRLPVSSVAA